MISDITLPKIAVLDSEMAYRESGRADRPVALFLHGNPTSSYIWRNILPAVAGVAHCIAPDLIGFGQSGKPDIAYRFEDHIRYLDAFLARKGITSAYLVAQDWGTALAFHLAARRPDFVRGLAFMEFTRPVATWEEFLRDTKEREVFRKFRTPGEGEKLILEDNLFVEGVLPSATVRKLTEEEMAVYRAPFPTPQSRRPTWRFPNELPIAGEPADVYATMERAHEALAASGYPKLLFAADPGALVPPAVAEELAGRLQDCRFIKLGAGRHYLQEDHPEAIGRAVRAFVEEVEARRYAPGMEPSWGWVPPSVTTRLLKARGGLMTGAKWTILVETTGADGATERIEIAALERDLSSPTRDDIGLRLAEAKDLLLRLQSFLTQDQVRRVSAFDRTCHCGLRRRLHDYRSRQVATLFGRVILRQPRWRPCECESLETPPNTDQACRQSRTSALIGGRATSELVRVQAELGARLSFREAARVMSVLLPTGKAANHTGIRRRLARTADRLQLLDNASPHRMSRTEGGPVLVALDGAHIRAVPGFQVRHFEVTVGRVETERQQARHFAVAPNVTTSRSRAIGNALRSRGWLPGREVTVLSDGDPALVESVRSAAGDRVTHILDWFHVSMRVRHVEQALAGLLASDLEQKGPFRYVDLDVSRLRHLIWNGYGDEARRALRNITDMAAGLSDFSCMGPVH